MSHITPVTTQFSDIECLAVACQELGLVLEQGEGLTVTDYYKKSVAVDARIPLGRYALGFQRQADGTLKMVSDFWGIQHYCEVPKVRTAVAAAGGSAERGMLKLLERPYGVAATKKEIARNPKYRGFRMQEEKNQEGEVVRLTLVRRTY